jgi:hypothetical protein
VRITVGTHREVSVLVLWKGQRVCSLNSTILGLETSALPIVYFSLLQLKIKKKKKKVIRELFCSFPYNTI